MPLDETKTKELYEALSAIREKAEKFGADSVEFKSVLEKTDGEMKAFAKAQDEINARIAKEAKAREEAEINAEARIKDLESEIVRVTSKGGVAAKDYKSSDEYKALNQYARRGLESLKPEQKSLLRTDDNTAGGYMTMPEMFGTLLRNITEISPVRQQSRVTTTGSKTLSVTRRDTIPVASFEGEAAQNSISNPSYAAETLTANRQSFTARYTLDQLVDSEFDLEAELNRDATEAFAKGEGNAFVNGNGSHQPQGFLNQPKLSAAFNSSTNPLGYITSSSSGAVIADDLLNLTGELKTGYDPVFAFNRRTMADFLQFKGTDGQYLFDFGNLAAGVPMTLRGYRIVMFEDMPDIAANSFSVVFGDFRQGFLVADRVGLQVIRDDVTEARNAIVNLTFHRWLTGQVVVPEAIRLLRTAA